MVDSFAGATTPAAGHHHGHHGHHNATVSNDAAKALGASLAGQIAGHKRPTASSSAATATTPPDDGSVLGATYA